MRVCSVFCTNCPHIQTCLCAFSSRLYNKEAIIQYLLDKDKYGDQGQSVAHIRGLKVRASQPRVTPARSDGVDFAPHISLVARSCRWIWALRVGSDTCLAGRDDAQPDTQQGIR